VSTIQLELPLGYEITGENGERLTNPTIEHDCVMGVDTISSHMVSGEFIATAEVSCDHGTLTVPVDEILFDAEVSE